MFTGIVEAKATLQEIISKGSNKTFWMSSAIASELQIDQSVSHNGVCLTVEEVKADSYCVTAIDETLQKTNLNDLKVGDELNLERCLKADGRFDGHIVQGHVDQTAELKEIINEDGSYKLTFTFDESIGNITVPKGSICINGISLTVVDSQDGLISVAIIPYTWEHTNLHKLMVGSKVNLEFDILGKYMQKILSKRLMS